MWRLKNKFFTELSDETHFDQIDPRDWNAQESVWWDILTFQYELARRHVRSMHDAIPKPEPIELV